MKKIYIFIFSIFSFILFNSNVYAFENKVNLTIDLEHNEHFNIFYELTHDTSLARELASHGRNFKGYLLDLYTDVNITDYTNYAIWLGYCPSDTEISNCHYQIDLNVDGSYFDNNVIYYFDEEMNFLETITTSLDIVNNNTFYGSTIQDNPYIVFSYYEGNFDYRMRYDQAFRFILHKICDDEKCYNLEGDETSWLERLWNGLFKNWYDNDQQQLNLEWYASHTIISQNIGLTPVHDTIMNFSKLDMDSSIYDSVFVNEYSNGIFLVPTVTSDNVTPDQVDMFAYMSSNNNYLKGALVKFDNGIADTSNIKYVYNANYGTFRLKRINIGSFGYGDMLGSNSIIEEHGLFHQYAIYFYTEDTAHDIKLFYDRSVYSLQVASDNSNTIIDPLTQNSSTIYTNSIRYSADEIIERDDVHFGDFSSKYPTGIPSSYIDSGGDKTKYANADGSQSSIFDSSSAIDNGKNLISTLKNGIGGFSSIISTFFEAFPQFSSLFMFALTSAIIIAILKLIF